MYCSPQSLKLGPCKLCKAPLSSCLRTSNNNPWHAAHKQQRPCPLDCICPGKSGRVYYSGLCERCVHVQRGATEAAEAARIFEGQLAGALVAEDGQLALSNLAASAAHGFMPKIQTQGQLGQARWRLVSAPSIPGIVRATLESGAL